MLQLLRQVVYEEKHAGQRHHHKTDGTPNFAKRLKVKRHRTDDQPQSNGKHCHQQPSQQHIENICRYINPADEDQCKHNHDLCNSSTGNLQQHTRKNGI